MTQNTEQNVRTRDEQVANAVKFAHLQPQAIGEFLGCYLDPMLREAEARGAEEQRRKDAEEQEPVAWVDAEDLPSEECQRRPCHLILKRTPIYSTPLYTHPANVAAMEVALKAIGDEVLEGAEPFCSAVVRILKTVGIDPLGGAEPDDPEAPLIDRIAHLEDALVKVRNAIEAADPTVLTCVFWMPGQPETVCDFIGAALTREGGA